MALLRRRILADAFGVPCTVCADGSMAEGFACGTGVTVTPDP